MYFNLRLVYVYYSILFAFLILFHGFVGFTSLHIGIVIFVLFVLIVSLFSRFLDIKEILHSPETQGNKISKFILLGLLILMLGFIAPNTNALFVGALFLLGLFGRYNIYVFTIGTVTLLSVAFLLLFQSQHTLSVYFLYYGFLCLVLAFFFSVPMQRLKIGNIRISQIPILFQDQLVKIFGVLQYVILVYLLFTWYFPSLTYGLLIFLFFHILLLGFMKKRKIVRNMDFSITTNVFNSFGLLLSLCVLTLVPIFDLYTTLEQEKWMIFMEVGLFLFLCILINLQLLRGVEYFMKNSKQYVYVFIGVQLFFNSLLFFYSQMNFQSEIEIDLSGIDSAQEFSLEDFEISDKNEDVRTLFEALSEAEGGTYLGSESSSLSQSGANVTSTGGGANPPALGEALELDTGLKDLSPDGGIQVPDFDQF